MGVFWTSGFQGSSISELCQAMGLAAPSLYAAFGSKEELFKEAIALYLSTEGSAPWQALEEDTCLQAAISSMLCATASLFLQTASLRGCLLVLGDKGLSPSSGSIHDWMKKQRDKKRKQLTTRLTRALSEGELQRDTDIDALASTIFIFMSGLSIETADGVTKEVLFRSIDAFMSSLKFLKKKGSLAPHFRSSNC
jgi:AcrR family transcriptional regulator